MKFFYNFICLIAFLYCPIGQSEILTKDFTATFAGIEVIGVDKSTAEKVRHALPVQIGDVFFSKDTEKQRANYLDIIKKNFLTNNVVCSFLLYGNNTVYLIIDFIPLEIKENVYRPISDNKENSKRIPKKLNSLYDQWNKRHSFLMNEGLLNIENYDKGFRDFKDPQLHNLAKKLNLYASKNYRVLLTTIRDSTNASERRKAAALLAWSEHPNETLEFILQWGLLNDPDQGVRNDLTRSLSTSIKYIKEISLLKKLFPSYCKQVTLPRHTDRNKALYSIREILQFHPDLSTVITAECKQTISYISEVSILGNVGGFASEILKIMEEQYAKNTYLEKKE